MNFYAATADRSESIETRPGVAAERSVIAERVEEALRATGYLPLRNLRVLASSNGLHLEGTVSTYHLKQLAQATALSVPGVRTVHNDVDVVSPR